MYEQLKDFSWMPEEKLAHQHWHNDSWLQFYTELSLYHIGIR